MNDKPIKILVIDDDITALDLVSFRFEERGYHVERAVGGVGAIEYVQEHIPDIIIVDLLMPQISGIETVKKIRAIEGASNIPIIAYTALDDAEVHQEALDAGCNEVLTKPCPQQRLVRCIDRYLLDS